MVTIQLFDSTCKCNNGNQATFYTSQEAHDGYFSGLVSTGHGISLEDVKISKLDDPILIEVPLEQAMTYVYGRADFGGKWIYFSVAGYQIERENKTWITVLVDWYESMFMQIIYKRGRIYRYNKTISGIQPKVNPRGSQYIVTNTVQRNIFGDLYGTLMFIHESETDKDYLLAFNPANRNNTKYYFKDFLEGIPTEAYPSFKRPLPDDVIGFWLVPNTVLYNFMVGSETASIDGGVYRQRDYEDIYSTASALGHTEISRPSLNGDQNRYKVITDCRGNVVWRGDYNKSYSQTYIQAFLNVSPSDCKITCYLTNSVNPVINGVTSQLEDRFSIPCEPLDLINDAYIQYQAQERPFNQESRRIQNAQSTTNALVSSGGSAINGAVGGAIAGATIGSFAPGVGTAIGAVAGFVVGVGGALITNRTTTNFNNQITKNEDNQALLRTDEIRLSGTLISDIVLGFTGIDVYEVSTDQTTINLLYYDIAAFGNYYDYETEDVSSLISVGAKMTATVDIMGISEGAKQQIQSRFEGGIQFV